MAEKLSGHLHEDFKKWCGFHPSEVTPDLIKFYIEKVRTDKHRRYAPDDILPDVMRPVRDVVSKAHHLLYNPQPDLEVWVTMTHEVIRDLFKVLDEAGAGTEPQ